MKTTLIVILMFILINCSITAQQIPDKENQINTAIQAAPEKFRDNATVLGYDADGKVTTLRKGTNKFICLADDPTKSGFSVACYHKSLEPFMKRGRELKSQGKSFDEIRRIRGEEVEAGKLEMPDKTTLYVMTGNYNTATGNLSDTYLRYVIYIPYATEESTGLSAKPTGPGSPWIMDPGTHRAHIMINPPKSN